MSRKKRFGKNFLERVSRIGTTGRYRVKGMAEGGVAGFESDILADPVNYPRGVTDKKGYDKMINQHYDEWSPSDGIPGEGNPHIGEKAIIGRKPGEPKYIPADYGITDKSRKGLGTMLYKLLGLDPVTLIKGRDGKPDVGRESSKFTET